MGVYIVRFRLPSDLAVRLNLPDLRRSLYTRDAEVARKRCYLAELWFKDLVVRLRRDEELTRGDLEAAAADYFRSLVSEVDVPRDMPSDYFEAEVDFNLEHISLRLNDLEAQLASNQFGREVEQGASIIASSVCVELTSIHESLQLIAKRLAAQALRGQMRYFEHQLTRPGIPYVSDHPAFEIAGSHSERKVRSQTDGSPRHTRSYAALGAVVQDHLTRMQRKGLGASHIDEVGRVLSWLSEELGADTPLDQITSEHLRAFRDNLQRIDRTRRGRAGAFATRLTDKADKQITYATAAKYWSGLSQFFAWAETEGLAPSNPALKLRPEPRKGEEPRSPAPFHDYEVLRFLSSPLYQGAKSLSRLNEAGDCHARGQHWWAGMLFMFTGARASELNQLLVSDFSLEDPIPHLRIQEVDSQGAKVKSVKTRSSVRSVPIAPVLLSLGLRHFIQERQKKGLSERVFSRFRVGTRGKLSEGMVRFWRDYLAKYQLHKPGRATHVWRHTVIAKLRAAGVPEEDIAALVGHDNRSMTSRYGGEYPLERKAEALKALTYSFDLLEKLGGEYDPSRHKSGGN